MSLKVLFQVSVVAVLVFVSGIASQRIASSPEKLQELVKKTDETLQHLADLNLWSGIVYLSKPSLDHKGEPLFHKSYGKAIYELDIPNKNDLVFQVGRRIRFVPVLTGSFTHTASLKCFKVEFINSTRKIT